MSSAGIEPLLGQVAAAVSEAIARVRPELADADPVVRRSDRADVQSNAALPLAKQIGIPPAQLSAELATHLDSSGGVIADVQVSGPGFLNITLSDRAVWEAVVARLSDERLGVPAVEHGHRVLIDYSAPNVAKEMHVGHLRTTIIGDSLARVLDFLGADVVRANHLGDWGTQFGMLIQYIDENPESPWHTEDLDPDTSTVSALDNLYKAARGQFDADPAFADRARTRVVALQAGDPTTLARWREIVAESEKAFGAIYDRLGVLLTPDDYLGESFYNDLLADTVTELVDKGVAVDSGGAIVVQSEQVKGPDDQPVVLMARKSDGGYGYDSTDLATIRYRLATLHADRLLYVTDSRQSLHFQLVFEAARRAVWLTAAIRADHVAYGTILSPDGKPFKTRTGGTVRVMDLLDEAVSRVSAVVAEKNPPWPRPSSTRSPSKQASPPSNTRTYPPPAPELHLRPGPDDVTQRQYRCLPAIRRRQGAFDPTQGRPARRCRDRCSRPAGTSRTRFGTRPRTLRNGAHRNLRNARAASSSRIPLPPGPHVHELSTTSALCSRLPNRPDHPE